MSAIASILARSVAALFYAGLLAAANPATAADPALSALQVGDMRRLVLHDAPVPAAETAFVGADGAETTLAAGTGKVRLVNFWATWCAPCRAEMPSLDALQRSRGGADFEVLAIATGRNAPQAIDQFRAEAGITDLPVLLDPKGKLAAASGVIGLPATLILDRDGNEVGRMLGEADWNAPEALAVIDALIAARP